MNKKWLAIIIGILIIGIEGICKSDIKKTDRLYIRYQNGMIDMEAKNVPLGEVLKEFSDNTGIRFELKGTAITKDIFSIKIKSMSIDETLKRILNDYSYTTRFGKESIKVIVYGSQKDESSEGQKDINGIEKTLHTEYSGPETASEAEEGPGSLDEFQPIQISENLEQEDVDTENAKENEPNRPEEERGMAEKKNRLERALAVLKSENTRLYEEAVNELLNIDDSSATNALFLTASSKDEKINERTKIIAAKGLWHHAADQGFSNKESIAALHQLAQDDNPSVRDIAKEALKDMENFKKMNTGE